MRAGKAAERAHEQEGERGDLDDIARELQAVDRIEQPSLVSPPRPDRAEGGRLPHAGAAGVIGHRRRERDAAAGAERRRHRPEGPRAAAAEARRPAGGLAAA